MGYFYCPLGPIKSKWYWFSELNRYPAGADQLVKLLGDLYVSAIDFKNIEDLSLGISSVSDRTDWEDHYTERLFKEAQVLQNNGYAAAATFPVVDFLSRINSRFRERLGAGSNLKASFESISDDIDSIMLGSYPELADALGAMLNLLRNRLASQQAA
jgi:hypothetical protein